jgi:hypothetical protein
MCREPSKADCLPPLLFTQIIPQAICTRYGLSVGAMAAPVVRILLVVFFPVAYPISKVLALAAEFVPFVGMNYKLSRILVYWSLVLGGCMTEIGMRQHKSAYLICQTQSLSYHARPVIQITHSHGSAYALL